MKASLDLPYFFSVRSLFIFLISISILKQPLKAQNYENQSIIYNSLLGGVSGGIGAVINKKADQKWFKAFGKGFLLGTGGGTIMYAGKKMNYLVGSKHELGYAWASRAVFSFGNSIVENAAANIDVWSRWHFDIGFMRFEFETEGFGFTPKIMPSTFGGVVFIAVNGGEFNINKTLRSGTLTFDADVIKFAPAFIASTPSNAIIITDIPGKIFYQTYAHEMVHAFQFQECSGFNYFVKPAYKKLERRSNGFKEFNKWFYLDRNYELMLINYFLINGSYKGDYNTNFLENEAEILSVGRSAGH